MKRKNKNAHTALLIMIRFYVESLEDKSSITGITLTQH